MKRFAQTVMLKDDPAVIRQYEAYHANPWPEVIAGNVSIGIQRVFIYRFQRLLFMYMETADDFDLERDMPKYMIDPRAQAWDALMRTFQEPVPGAPPGVTWVPMAEIFSLEAHL